MFIPTRGKWENPKTLFLLDGLGALLSCAMLGLVLPGFEQFFGMPHRALYPLAAIAGLFCLYSLGCFFSMPARWRSFLKTIAVANLAYCGLTAGAVVCWRRELTLAGFAYFFVEMAIIVVLARIEWRTADRSR